MRKEQVDEIIGDIHSPLSKSELAEIVRDLKKLGMSPEQIEDTLQGSESETDALNKYDHLVFEDIILSYGAQREAEWPDIRYCQHSHKTIEAARSCAMKLGTEWYVVKHVACGFEGQLLSDMIELENRILHMKNQPFEERSERLTNEQLDNVIKGNKRNIQRAKSMSGTRSIRV